MKIFRSSVLGLGLVSVLLAVSHAQAQTKAQGPACDLTRETISVLRAPVYGSLTSWEASYGAKGQHVQFAGGVALPQHTVMAYAGRIDQQTSKAAETGLLELNRRGRTMVERFYPAKDDEQPVALAQVEDRFVGASNIRVGKSHDRHVRLSFYERDGTFKSGQTISDAAYDLEALRIIPAVDGAGFVVLIHAVARRDKTDQSAMLMRFTADGKQVWKRSYRPGTSNKLAGLAATDDSGYIATGGIMMNDGRMGGWVLKLSYDGTILWQRTYPRGKYALLNAGAVSPKKTPDGVSYYIVTGVATPADSGPDAAWVMELDPHGELFWQRYLRRPDYRFEGQDIKPQKDGRFVVSMNAAVDKPRPDYNDHIRMVTLSARGAILNDESFLRGLKARVAQVAQSSGGDIALTATVLQPQKKPEEEYGPHKPLAAGQQPAEPPPLEQGWIAVVPAPAAYDDPCGPVRR